MPHGCGSMGADEALMLDDCGFVSSCNLTSSFIIRGEELWTSTGNTCFNRATFFNEKGF
jgi:branched-chain amino acid aminotransferase